MRVLHIGAGNLYGGVETIQVTLARLRGECPEIELHFAVCFEGRLSQELSACEVPVHQLGGVRVRNPISILQARARLRALLSILRFDAVICHSAWTQAIFGPVVKEAGVSLLFWLHGAPSGQHWLERWAGQTRPDLVICCSEFTAGLQAKLYPGVPSEVLYPPVPRIMRQPSDSRRLALRSELQTPADAVVIIQVSRMEAWKGHRLHLEALAQMRDMPDWMCWFAGGPQRPLEASYLEELKRSAEHHGIADRVRFLGQRSDVQDLLAAADLFCQPNTGPEPFGVVFVEALWAGLPVITTGSGGGLEIVDASCGVLSPPNDAGALAAVLSRFVRSAELRRQMSEAAPERARKLCESSQQLKRLAGLIEETFTRRGAA